MYVDFHHNELANDEAAAQTTLAAAVRFDDADLAINKAGKLSMAQVKRLSFQVLAPFVVMVSTAVGFVSFGMALWLAGPLAVTKTRLLLAVGKYFIVGVGTAFFGLLAFIVKLMLSSGRVFLFFQDLIAGKAVAVTGRMHASKAEDMQDGPKEKSAAYNCVVKGEYFEIKEDAYKVLLDRSGSNYTIYLTPRSRLLLAIEPAVPDAKARDPFKLEYKPQF